MIAAAGPLPGGRSSASRDAYMTARGSKGVAAESIADEVKTAMQNAISIATKKKLEASRLLKEMKSQKPATSHNKRKVEFHTCSLASLADDYEQQEKRL